MDRFFRVRWIDRRRSCDSSYEFLSTHAVPKHRASLWSLTISMPWTLPTDTFRAVANSWMLICLHQCFHFIVINFGRPTGAMSVFDWKITITESGEPVLTFFWWHFCRKLDATFSLLQFLLFSLSSLFWSNKTEYCEYALQNSPYSNHNCKHKTRPNRVNFFFGF